MVMIDPERIQRLAEKLGNRNDSLELVRQMRCGGEKYPGGGKFFRTNLQQESPMMYQPILPSYPDVPTPMRYEPQPHYGLYEYPASTGMAESYPVTLPPRVPVTVSRNVSAPEVVEVPVENLFSDEMIARRALKQRYAESAFNDKAKSKAGAQGAWQIMPITLKDYLGRGRGKSGDLNDPEYNRKVRDWVMGIIPRDLQEFWSDSDSDRAKLAKLYAAYNWGAGNLRGFLRKKQKAGVDISNPDNWVDDLNPETRRYVKYLAFDEDIPDSIYTNSAFEDAARKRGYMAEGGRLFRNGGRGDKKQNWFTRATLGAMMADSPAVAQASGWTHSNNGDIVQTEQDSEGAKKLRAALAEIAAMPLTDLAVDVAGAAVVGTRTYKAMRLAREMNRALKSGEYDAAIEMARKASSDSPKNITHIVSLSPRNNLVELTEPSTIRLTPDDIRYMNYDFGSGAGYSGYTPTNQSADAARFVQDVNEGVTWGLNRGKLKPSSSVDMSGSIGEYIGGGGEASVFADANDGGRVLKVLADDTPFEDRLGHVGNLMRDNVIFYDTPADAVSAAERFVSEKNMRPYNIVQNVEGYIPSKTTPGKYHPVISQARVRGGMPSVEQMGKFEDPFFRRNNILNEYDMPEWYDLDLEPFNVGELPNGVLMGIDLKKDGGRIRIKPSHRGRLTELKARTGKSEAELYNDGNPAHKKMVVFARNARKWKHENGGYMNRYDGETEATGQMERIPWWQRAIQGATMAEAPAVMTASGMEIGPDGTITYGNDNEGVRRLRRNLVGIGLAGASGTLLSGIPGAVNWLSNPANQIVATKMAVPLLGGAAVEEGVKSYTPYSGVGNLLYNAPTVPWSNWSPAYSQARRGAPQWERNLTEGLLGFANPGYFLSPELMAPAMDRVMQGYASDFATHVKEPLKKANQYARDWYDFVVKGNDARYRDALSNVLSLKGEEEMLAMGLRPYEYNAASYPKYSINYQDAALESGNAAAGSMRMYPSEVVYGSDQIPMVVEDIGIPGNTRVTFLRSVPEGDLAKLTPGEYENIVFENASRPHNRIYRQTAIGDEYVSPLTGQVRKSPSAVLAKPEPARGNAFVASGADNSELIESYAKEVSGGSHIPVQRGEASGAAKIAKHIEEDVMPLVGDDVALTGSTVLYKNKILSGKPGDYEFLVAEEDFPALERKLQMTGTFDNGFAIEGSSPLLRSGNGSHNVDAQVVRMDKYGEANGKVAWSLFKTMHPEEYEAQAANSIGLNKNFYDMHIINPSTGLPYKPKELIAEFKNGGYDTQHVINEAMAISKPYNKAPKGSLPGTEQNAIDLLKQDRALSLLTSKDPQVKSMVRKAIDDNARTALGADYVHGHDFFPGLDFTDAKNNEVFLKHLGINPKNIADDPEMMRNIFDQWFLVRTSRYREVANMPNMAGVKRAVGTGNVPMQGSVAASGRNAVSGGYYGSTVGDPQRGMFQQMPTYRTEMSDMTDMGDIMKMFKRTEEGYKFTSQEAKELNDELVSIFTDMQNDMSLREGGIGRNGAKKILAKLQSSPIKTLEELDEFFNKARGSLQNNGLSDITASDIIQRVSEKIDIPEFIATGRWNYQNKYTGIWNRNAPRAASYRYTNDGYWKPFEVGRDFRDFGVVSGKSGSDKSPISLYEADLLPDDGSRQLMQAIYEGGTLGTDANTLLRAGAKPIYSDKTTEELIEHLREIREVNDLGAKELGYLRKYFDMPFAKKRIGKIEYETGLNYRNGQVNVHGKRFGNRSMESLGDEMIKTAPFDKRYGYIRDISATGNGSYRVKAVNDKGQEIEYFVSRDKSNKNAWKWEVNNVEDDLPFALGGYIDKINSKYRNDPDKIRLILANARSRQKK